MSVQSMSLGRYLPVRIQARFACFTIPQLRAEGMTYDIPTPSALSGVMHSAHPERNVNWVPVAFCLLAPVKKYSMGGTEHANISSGVGPVGRANQIRQREFLRDVDYAVWYRAVERLSPDGQPLGGDCEKAVAKARRKLGKGRYDRVPHLGVAECVASVSSGPREMPERVVKDFRVYRMFHSFPRYQDGDGVDPIYYMPEVGHDGLVVCDPAIVLSGLSGVTWFGLVG